MRFESSRWGSLLSILVVLASTGCAKLEAWPVTAIGTGFGSLDFSQSDYYERTRLVIRSDAEWQGAWLKLSGASITGGETAPVPPIDFSKDMVVVVGMGPRPTSGYLTWVAGAAGDGETLEISVTEVELGHPLPSGCLFLTSYTQPAGAARLPRFEGEVRFTTNTVTPGPCK